MKKNGLGVFSRLGALVLGLAWIATLLTLPARAGVDSWTLFGPEASEVREVIIDPGDSDVLYARMASGRIYRSTNGGGYWSQVGQSLPGGKAEAMAVLPGEPSTLFAGTSEGLFRSEDGGSTWSRTAELRINQLVAVPADPLALFAVANRDLFKSNDGGNSWQRLLDEGDFRIYAVTPDPFDPQTLYLGTDDGVFRSTDGGESFAPRNHVVNGEPLTYAWRLFIAPSDPMVLYASDHDYFYRSTDGGASWYREPEECIGTPDAVVVSREAPLTIYMGGCGPGVRVSEDGGASWRSTSAGLPRVDEWRAVVIALAIDPRQPQILYAGTKSHGVYKSRDGGVHWFAVRSGLRDSIPGSLALDPNDPETIYVTIRETMADDTRGRACYRLYKSSDHGRSWRRLAAEVGCSNIKVHVDPIDSATIYLVTGWGSGSLDDGLYRSTNGGETWQSLPWPCRKALTFDPTDRARILCANEDGAFRTTDRGASWELVWSIRDEPSAHEFNVIKMVFDPSVPGTVYGYADVPRFYHPDECVYKSSDGGTTWQRICYDCDLVELIPGDPSTVYMRDSGLNRSTDGGLTWEEVNFPGDNLFVVHTRPPIFYSSDGTTVYRSADLGNTWDAVPFWVDYLPGSTGLAAHPAAPERIFTFRSYDLDGFQVAQFMNAEPLQLAEGRIEVRSAWRDFAGRYGPGHPHPLTADTGAFWFFEPGNLELAVKVLDGRAINDFFWVFYGALSNVEYTFTVRDTLTGQTKDYFNPPGQLASVGDTRAWPAWASSLDAPGHALLSEPPDPKPPCEPGPETLCLAQNRFRVQVDWYDFQGRTGRGNAVPLSDETGSFWFFGDTNLELLLKVLDGRPVNGHFWVFYGALSNVGYFIAVTDTATGAVRLYHNPLGRFASAADVRAF